MRLLPLILVFPCFCKLSFAGEAPVDALRVMTFNVWTGEETAAGRSKLVEIIQAANADVVGLQEMGNAAGQQVAAELGFHYHQQSASGIQVVSRFPVAGQTPRNLGVEISVSPSQNVWLFNAHLPAFPYQPYDLRDGSLPQNETAVIAAANAARGGPLTAYLDELIPAMASNAPVFFTGDFNEPSHIDWTQAAAEATLRDFDLKVEYPTSKRIADAGLTDAFRDVRPDEVNDAAYTWTPGYPPPTLNKDEVHDRIDFIYHAGSGVSPLSAATIGLDAGNPNTDVGVAGYNADHRAVVVEFLLPPCTPLIGDIDENCSVDTNDWLTLRDNQHRDLNGLTPAEAAALGDLNGDLRNDHADFVLFKRAFEIANGAGSFENVVNVPEAGGLTLFALAVLSGTPMVATRRAQ